MKKAQSFLSPIFFLAVLALLGLMYHLIVSESDIKDVRTGSRQEAILSAFQKEASLKQYATQVAYKSLEESITDLSSSNYEQKLLQSFTEQMRSSPISHSANYLIKKEGGVTIIYADGGVSIPIETPDLFPPSKQRSQGVFNVWPVQTNPLQVTSLFGGRNVAGNARASRNHPGLDIDANGLDPILSLSDGVVKLTGNNYLYVEHDVGWTCGYFHVQDILVKPGDKVSESQTIAKAQTITSDHLDIRCYNHLNPLTRQEAEKIFGSEHVSDTLSNTPGVTTYAVEYSINGESHVYLDAYCLFSPVIKEQMKQSIKRLVDSGYQMSSLDYRSGNDLYSKIDDTCKKYEDLGLINTASLTSAFVDSLIEEVIAREGGFVNDPDDRGGATKYGITQDTLQAYRSKTNTAAVVSVDDVKALTKEEAKQIYREEFYEKYGVDKMPLTLIPVYFDMVVNHGPVNAEGIMLDALKLLGYSADKNNMPDVSLMAINDLGEQKVIDAVVDSRIKFYNNIVKNNPSQQKFLKGWISRAESFREPQVVSELFGEVIRQTPMGEYVFELEIPLDSNQITVLESQKNNLINKLKSCKGYDYSCINAVLHSTTGYYSNTVLCTEYHQQINKLIASCPSSCDCELIMPAHDVELSSERVSYDIINESLTWAVLADEDNTDIKLMYDGTEVTKIVKQNGVIRLVTPIQDIVVDKLYFRIIKPYGVVVSLTSQPSNVCSVSIPHKYCYYNYETWVDHPT